MFLKLQGVTKNNLLDRLKNYEDEIEKKKDKTNKKTFNPMFFLA